jgi:hypothetical protein
LENDRLGCGGVGGRITLRRLSGVYFVSGRWNWFRTADCRLFFLSRPAVGQFKVSDAKGLLYVSSALTMIDPELSSQVNGDQIA